MEKYQPIQELGHGEPSATRQQPQQQAPPVLAPMQIVVDPAAQINAQVAEAPDDSALYW
eukprot:CAMPEP_0197020894 /NCGR_PEP_ID=MMETSP1384-20130603/1763_1 /TAXON_ID=29189 /ORGANISM="Ammonia sp." /LENGTH=58 /DNA_ID=CAMNT_0042448617 /DNA_START=106 /DNA_END=279 /DNA_ORIENTATION=+